MGAINQQVQRVWVLALFLCCGAQWSAGQVRISEVDPSGELLDDLGRGEDWIELVNEGDQPVALNGLALSDDPDNWGKWSLPNVTMASGERLLLRCSGRDVSEVHHWESPANEDDIWRYKVPTQAMNANWRTLDFNDSGWASGLGSFGFGDGDDAVEVSGNTVFLRKSFSVYNLEELVHGLIAVDYDDGHVAFLNGRELTRSETMVDVSVAYDALTNGLHEAVLFNGGTPDGFPFDPREWLVPGNNVLAVQVHNASATSSDLTVRPFLALGRSESTPVPYDVLPGWWNPTQPDYHTNFKLKPGEPVILSNADGDLLDLATLPLELRPGLTMGRADGSEDWCFFTEGTPGSSNGTDCLSQLAPKPVVEPVSGVYTSVAVSATSGTPFGGPGQNLPPMTLRYTVDGSEPTEASPVCTGFWSPTETSILSLRAFGEGLVPSETVDRTYFVDEPETGLQKVSILTHPDHLWDWNTGIYVSGPNAGTDYPYFGSNFWEPWSRESRLTWFDSDLEPAAESRFDLEIHGGWSRAESQRSFRLDFKNRYTGPMEHAVFASKPNIEAFGNLNLRNGGQASWENKFQDAFYGELALETNVVASGWRPVEVYLNGEYWGVYGAREKADEQFVEDNFGWDKNEVDLVSAFTSLNGSPSAFETTVEPLLQLPDGSAAFHDAFAANFDVATFIDYHIFEIHGQNVDWIAAPWGQNNVKYFRPNNGDGLWRPMMYDTDACFGAWGTSPYESYLNLTLNPPYTSRFTDLFSKVLSDVDYQCQFATRTCDLLETSFAPENFDVRLNITAGNMAPAMVHHIENWGSPASVDYWQSRVEYMRNHNEERAAPERNHVREEFGYEEAKLVSLGWTPPFGGQVTVNEMDNLGAGWDGEYFGECPIRLAALPAPNFGFFEWESNVHVDLGLVDVSSPFIEVGLEEDDLFFAVFGPCMEGVDLSIGTTNSGLTAIVSGTSNDLELSWHLNGDWVGSGFNYSPSADGAYTLTASDGNCTLISSPFEWPSLDGGEVVSVQAWEPEGKPKLSVVPNPSSGPVVVSGQGGGDLKVFDPSGRVCFSVDNIRLPYALGTASWTPGVYAVSVVSEQKQQSTRFVLR